MKFIVFTDIEGFTQPVLYGIPTEELADRLVHFLERVYDDRHAWYEEECTESFINVILRNQGASQTSGPIAHHAKGGQLYETNRPESIDSKTGTPGSEKEQVQSEETN